MLPTPMQRLSQKVILIVGGTSGLGLSASLACAAEGASLVVVGRDDDHLRLARESILERSGASSSRVIAGDASDPTVAAEAVALAIKQFGGLDAAYHVAGGSGRRMGDGPLDQITDEGWRYTLDSNLTSLFNTNRAAVRQFLAQGKSRAASVLNIGSVLGVSPSPRFFSTHAYAAAKAAVIGLTKSCAAYYAPHNVRFNVIAPSLVETPMSRRAAEDPVIAEFTARKQPLDGGRIGAPGDFDSAVVYFLSDESKFVTGQVLAIDGGWSVTEA